MYECPEEIDFIENIFCTSGLGASVMREVRIFHVSTLPLVLPMQSTQTLQYSCFSSGATADASAISDTLVKH